MVSFKSLGQPYLDHGLARYPESLCLAVQLVYHPYREINVDPFGVLHRALRRALVEILCYVLVGVERFIKLTRLPRFSPPKFGIAEPK